MRGGSCRNAPRLALNRQQQYQRSCASLTRIQMSRPSSGCCLRSTELGRIRNRGSLHSWQTRSFICAPGRSAFWPNRAGPGGVGPALTKQAVEDPSPAVRLELASALQWIPTELREPLAAALVRHGEDVQDHNLPLMLWYGIEPIASAYPTNAIHLAQQSRIPLVREYIARRLGEQLGTQLPPVENLLETFLNSPVAAQLDILHGLATAVQGWHQAPRPQNWEAVRANVASSKDPELQRLAQGLGVVFGDARALQELQQTAFDASAMRKPAGVHWSNSSAPDRPICRKIWRNCWKTLLRQE